MSSDEGLTDFYVDEIATRRVLIANSATTYVLADSSNSARRGLPTLLGGVEEVTAFITDQAPPARIRYGGRIRTAGWRILNPPGDHTSG